MGRVDGKVALVTGAADGIGRACAMTLASEGAAVVVTDVQEEAGAACAAQIEAVGGSARFLTLDTSDEAQWRSVISEIAATSGALHVLVNNAGVFARSPVVDMTLDAWRRLQAVNVEGVFLGVKHALPLIRRSGGGSIVNMSSVAGLKGASNFSAYCASKGAVRLFTKAVALECAAAKDGVRVNSVHPGLIETRLWRSVLPGRSASGGEDGLGVELDAMAARAVPLGVAGRAEDVAAAVLFLASDDSRYVTGSELVIDGGASAD